MPPASRRYDPGMSTPGKTADELGLPRRATVAEYFEIADAAIERCEYRAGTVVRMPVGTEFHSLIGMNVGSAIGNRTEGSQCRTYNPNLRIGVRNRPHFMYPDLSVIYGPTEHDPRDASKQSATNPRLIVEVLSPSTELYDRGEKFRRYLQIPSFQEYVLVAQDRPRVETLFRQGDGTWSLSFANGPEASIHLRSLDIDVPLSVIYANVEFPPLPDDEVEPAPSQP